MISVIEGRDAIEIQSNMMVGQRILFLVLALFPLLAPYQLIIRPDWQSYFNLFFLFVLVISLGAVIVSSWSTMESLHRLRAVKNNDEAIHPIRKRVGFLAGILVKLCHEQSKLENGQRVRRYNL